MDKINDGAFFNMVASGMRSIGNEYQPDCWIIKPNYIPYTDGLGRIFDLPVFRCDFSYDDGWTSMPVLMIPCWLDECIDKIELLTRKFLEGCEDEWLTEKAKEEGENK